MRDRSPHFHPPPTWKIHETTLMSVGRRLHRGRIAVTISYGEGSMRKKHEQDANTETLGTMSEVTNTQTQHDMATNVSTNVIASGIVDRLRWRAYVDRTVMGAAAVAYVEGLVEAILANQPGIRIIFSAAPSQDELLAGLAASTIIDWTRVTAFHMDEYIGIEPTAPQGFGQFLRTRLFANVPLAAVHYLDVTTRDPVAECQRYGTLLAEAPIDLCCSGIGENGHLAFNDPPVADFADPAAVKVVTLDDVCRQQQVHDGCFRALSEVPTHAMTLTIPTLMAAKYQVCVVPAATKRDAVRKVLSEPEMTTEVPATALRGHGAATLFLDALSYGRFL